MYCFRNYDENKSMDRAWFISSTILYSECDDTDSKFKTLRVTFKNGSTYEYYDVDVNDYLMFLHGGLDYSSGKALNKYIKAKYNFKRIADKNPKEIQDELQRLKQGEEGDLTK